MLYFFYFICLCTNRLNISWRVLANGTIARKENQFTKAIDDNGPHFFCAAFNPDWFSEVRFDSECAVIEIPKMVDGFITKPKPFGSNGDKR